MTFEEYDILVDRGKENAKRFKEIYGLNFKIEDVSANKNPTLIEEKRKLIRMILCVNDILIREFKKRAEYIVVDWLTASLLQSDCSDFVSVHQSIPNHIVDEIFLIGSLAGMKVYVNPKLSANDICILVGADRVFRCLAFDWEFIEYGKG